MKETVVQGLYVGAGVLLPDKVLVCGACAVVPDPTAEQLAYIAVASADTAARFGIDPRMARLSRTPQAHQRAVPRIHRRGQHQHGCHHSRPGPSNRAWTALFNQQLGWFAELHCHFQSSRARISEGPPYWEPQATGLGVCFGRSSHVQGWVFQPYPPTAAGVRLARMENTAAAQDTKELSIHDCWKYLQSTATCRIALVNGDVPEIFPVNYVPNFGTVLFRIGQGTKLNALRESPVIALEADGFNRYGTVGVERHPEGSSGICVTP